MTDWYSGTPTLPRSWQYEPVLAYDGTYKQVHPAIVYKQGGWNGYEYWLCITPYASASVENPSIYCSTDGRTWLTPAGVTNPVVPYPGTSNNNDPSLFLTSDNVMVMTWGRADLGRIYYKTSTDGSTWSATGTLWQHPTIPATQLISPTIRWTGTEFRCWFTPETRVGFYYMDKASANGTLAELIGGSWGAWNLTALAPPSGYTPNHTRVVQVSGGKCLAFMTCDSGTQNSMGMSESSDAGVTWSSVKIIQPATTSLVWDQQVYSMDAVEVGGVLRCWYIGVSTAGYYLGYSELNTTGDTELRPWIVDSTTSLLGVSGLVALWTVTAAGALVNKLGGAPATITGNGGVLPNVRAWSGVKSGGVGYCADFTSAVSVSIPTKGWNPSKGTMLVVRGAQATPASLSRPLYWGSGSGNRISITSQNGTYGRILGLVTSMGVSYSVTSVTSEAATSVGALVWQTGTSCYVYRDTVKSTAGTSMPYPPSGMPFNAFVGSEGTSNYFGGPIQAVAIFDKKLSDAEIATANALINGTVTSTRRPSRVLGIVRR